MSAIYKNYKRSPNLLPIFLAVIGLTIFITIAAIFPFKDKLFTSLYPKTPSKAASDVSGATFSLTYPSAVNLGDQVTVTITTRTDTHRANLFYAKLNFDTSKLEVTNIDSSNSFVTQWVEKRFNNTAGNISVIGGVPKPGFLTSGTDATVATITFLTKSPGIAAINFDPASAIYRNSDNANFLIGTTGAVIEIKEIIIPSITPTITITPTASPTPTDIPSPTPTPTSCTLSQARWLNNQNPVDEGTLVSLEVSSGGNCDGKQVQFEVREDDGIFGSDPTKSPPATATFSNSNLVSSSWVAEYQPDGLGGISDPPEYYFTAILADGSSSIISTQPELQVNKSTSTIYKTGDANHDGKVDLQDLSILLSYWGDTTNFPDQIDIINDNLINTFDFSGMLVILKQEGIIEGNP